MRRAVLCVLLLLTACAQPPGSQPGLGSTSMPEAKDVPKSTNLVRDGYQGRFETVAEVLESPQHGPQLCTGGMALSLPPQCGGPDIKGWKWDGLKAESVSGTTWGTYRLIGTFDGKVFTLTEPASASEPVNFGGSAATPDFTSPCTPPRPMTDPARATDSAMQEVNQLAREHPDFGELWLDQPQPAGGATPDGSNDPTKYVLNVSFTKDLAAREADIRKVWGGALCVSLALRTAAELQRIQGELMNEPGMTWGSPSGILGVVEIGVHVAHEKRQRELDAKYGAGTVILYGALKPID